MPQWSGLSPFLYLSFRDCGCGKVIFCDGFFREDQPNKILTETNDKEIINFKWLK